MEVVAKAMGLVIFPLTLIDVAILVKQSAKEVSLVVLPVTLVKATVRPYLDTFTLTDFSSNEPFSDIA